jgi:micrococcal nuclease
MKKLIFLVFVLITGCITGNTVVKEDSFEGPFRVIDVIDGDTLDINTSERVRLSGINTPEIGECYYQEAKDKLKELTLGKDVFLERDISDTGKYGRLLRYIYADNVFVNSELVEDGFARVYDKYKDYIKRYHELKEVELIAREKGLGVWSCKDPREGCLYVGSKNSNKYHTPRCKWSKRIKPQNLVCYMSEEEVKNLEFSGC